MDYAHAAAEEAASADNVAELAAMDDRIARADAAAEEAAAEAWEDAAASAETFSNAHFDANLCDADYYLIRRGQQAARNAWLLDERTRLAAEKEKRKVDDFNRWVLADIARTERRKRGAAMAEQNAAEFALVKAEQAAKRARNASRLALELREAFNARHVQQRDGDADSAF